jgi:anti-sigma regulatory factor (Ser/Thr protein kinase)
MVDTAASRTGGFRHDALLYQGMDEFCAGVADFVQAGAEAGEPALVVATDDRLERLAGMVDDRVVRLADMADVGANPARIIAAWREFVDEHPDRPVRGVGEPIWAGRTPAEIAECQQHERLLNLAFPDATGFWLRCPYDLDALPSDVITEAQRSHPVVASAEGSTASGAYADVDPLTAVTDGAPLPSPPARAAVHALRAGRLDALRDFVATGAAALGLSDDRAWDLTVAVNEVATNSVLYGGSRATVHLWRERGTVRCELTDAGLFVEPLAGRVHPGDGEADSRGLWMANQLCDLVQLRLTPDGTVVRLHVRA